MDIFNRISDDAPLVFVCVCVCMFVCADVATVVGYLSVSQPFLDLTHPRHMHSSHSEIMLVRGGGEGKGREGRSRELAKSLFDIPCGL